MNKAIITGRLTRDPELRYTANNKAVCDFTIATNRPVVRDGERVADFINCRVWNKSAENLVKYQTKGNLIAVIGRMQVRSYEDDKGNKRNITEVVADSIEYLGTKKKDAPEYDAVNNARREEPTPYDIKGEGNGIEIQGSDLPF